ncbi:hypothetical protein [Novosphingobium album (ex Liu et al. 2023)]|uniref:Uncharacterized protein n=1 Tax=Novosphingobium album (ex Liu et al. 2023) TaxID=3031130 RepID=A0ABT5WY09_9SPHN|nr:hypothetical protein [Novosphingobium album (ex Liu et al. 2023)]MDE8654807.1 hypothetical protein [Novosphingobium album (ex Liu et al. 2023)]
MSYAMLSQFTCDRCGEVHSRPLQKHQEKFLWSGPDRPSSWLSVHGRGGHRHLCEHCAVEFDAWVEGAPEPEAVEHG